MPSTGIPWTSAAQGFFHFQSCMPDITLSPAAQQWVYVVLIWVGFGTLAGLLATLILPLRRSIGPFAIIAMGIVGSTIGLLGLTWLFPDKPLNPISPLGFLAATIGAFLLLVLHRLGSACFGRRKDDGQQQE
jgi:uncharacterized membrane protein YeaQ/YmgE (transglycosylase-associated protein family)